MLLIAASWVDEEFQLGCGEDQGTSTQSTSSDVGWLWLLRAACCLLPISWKKKVVMGVTERDPATKFKPSSFLSKYEQPILYVQACHK